MCGILGRLSANNPSSENEVRALLGTLRHRGPDDSGCWRDDNDGVLLGQTRLSVLDLSPAGHQPMLSRSERYAVVFNGEIYNHQLLRSELGLPPASAHDLAKHSLADGGSCSWRGESDTETLLAAIECWGLAPALERSIGMFALALWDRKDRTLHLARDRMGEKPLYYGIVGGGFAFGSELKVFHRIPGFTAEVDRNALSLFVRYSCVPAPHCIYRGLLKLVPGTVITIAPGDVAAGHLPDPIAYWSAMATAIDGSANPLIFENDAAAVDALEDVLSRAVGDQMIADVPLGAFLSGGVDSSTIVALMQARSRASSAGAVKTFSVGFRESAYDESSHAKAVANHLGTDHTEIITTAADALAVIPLLPQMYDEPFADSSQIPTHLVAAVARQKVTVALSGDGGDEVFGGYNRHVLASRMWPMAERLPVALRQGIAGAIRSFSPAAWNEVLRVVEPALPARYRMSQVGSKLHRIADVLGSRDGAQLYGQLVCNWLPESIVLGVDGQASDSNEKMPALPTLAEQMMAMDAVTYLPDDILVKVDRAAMAVSLETRVPLLDHRVFEFAWRLPLHYKIRDGVGKWILRQVLYRHVPRSLIERPKMGFGVPIDSWLRGPLREWAEELIDEGRLRREGYFRPEPIRRRWAEHQSGKRDWHHSLWAVLMFQAWLEKSRAEELAEIAA